MKRYCWILLLLAFSSGIIAQTATVKGFVYDESNGEPIIFTNVYLEGTNMGSATDINGFYSIPKIPVGEYTLISTYLGMDTVRVQISLSENQVLTKQLFLEESDGINLDVIEISATKQEAKTEVKTSTINISPKQINKIPAVGGEPDLAQYLQVLPGVVFSGDQGGQLYVRGGAPIQTKVLLDGLTIYNPFHSIGLFSVFETDIIKNVDVLTGGFNAENGGRISAVIDVATKDGNKKEFDGKVSINTLMAKAVLEGPIIPLTEKGNSASFVLSIKNSFLDQSSKTIYPYIESGVVGDNNGENIGLPYNFNDIYGKVSFNSKSGNKISLFGFDFRDNSDFPAVAKYGWKSSGGGLNFVVVPGRSKFLIDGKFAYSGYTIDLENPQNKNENKRSAVNGFNVLLDFNYFLPNGKLIYGLDAAGFSTFFDEVNSSAPPEEVFTTELAAFVTYKIELGKFVIEPSVRVVNYASINSSQIEPRFGMKWNVTNNLRFKASTGRFTQNLLSTKSDRDVVGLFTGFRTAPEGQLYKYNEETSDLEEVDSKVQIANHFIAGIEVDLTKRLNLNVEGYYKDYEQLINVNRNKVFSSDPDWIVEDGEAYGLDVLMKYDFKRWYLWGVYSLGFVTRTGPNGTGDVQTYPPHYDRRHNVNLLGSYIAGKNSDWEFSVRWNLGSGFPFTKQQGIFEQVDFSEGIGTPYTSSNAEEVSIIYDEDLNSGRLPYYHRLDASVKKTFVFSDAVKMEVVASVTNVYDRPNLFFVDRITNEKVNQLPILPSLGISLSF